MQKYAPKLVGIDRLAPALYNPRETDPYRLKLICNSIERLGWLLPLYGTKAGDGFELISGHQRSLAASLLGYTEVPFIELPDMPINKRKSINILFNRGTNDFGITDSSNSSLQRIQAEQYDRLLAEIPVSENHYPCMNSDLFDLKTLYDKNQDRTINYARNAARTLSKHGVVMPIIVNKDTLEVVNGIGRVQYLLERGISRHSVVWLDPRHSELAKISLNLISMNFTLEKHYEDHLRFSSFRRPRNTRHSLGRGFVFKILKERRLEDFDFTKKEGQELWRKSYGDSILDFGAGHLTESKMLAEAGFKVASFEPYRVAGKDVCKKTSIECVKEFLEKVESGIKFDSIFVSSVLNSVPFRKDREHIIQICSALASRKTILYIAAMHRSHKSYVTSAINERFDKIRATVLLFKLDYEEGIILGDFSESPKVQKYHSTQELHDVIKTAFNTVSVKLYGDTCCATAKDSTYDPITLREALEFEFNLPYPDGSRMNLVKEAIEAFEKRLKIKL